MKDKAPEKSKSYIQSKIKKLHTTEKSQVALRIRHKNHLFQQTEINFKCDLNIYIQ